ncbi:tripartite tricarboxylate transporter permease [Candidatus Woesearchaeota archaeon]|nr:tripartite tricarboxylate transporter permease [Candidatus Woesearchaeota archaeon]
MFSEIFLAILCGIGAGIVTGLIPGIHVNLVSLIVLSSASFFLAFTSPFVLVIFIIALAVTHTFLDFIPSALLGVPDADTALSVLPAHRLVMEGRAYECIKLTVIGSLLSVLTSIAFIPIMILLMPLIYEYISKYIGHVLVIVVAFMIIKERTKHRIFWAAFIFFVSGTLGYVVLNFPGIKDPLFPLLSGLFGMSMLINSLFENSVIPKQRVTEDLDVSKKVTVKSLAAGTIAGSATGLLPGLGAAQASIIASTIVGDIGVLGYLMLQGAINTVNFLLSLVTLYTIEKARNGAIVAVLEIIGRIELSQLCAIVAATLIVAGIATYLALNCARVFSNLISTVNYKLLCITIILCTFVLVFIFSGFLGLFVLLISTSVGLIPIHLGIGKNHGMGCLMLPVIIYFLV